MNFLRLLALCVCTLVLAGCASAPVSLQEVREFADLSTKLAGYAELSTRFRDTYAREQPYLTPAADRIARDNDAMRREAYDGFLSAQKTLVLYMQTLSALSGDGRYDLSERLDDLGAGVRSNVATGIEQRHVTAYTGLTRLLTRVIASHYQNRSVETMVRDGDSDVQVLLEAMAALLRYYEKTYDNEKKTVLGIFEVELPFSTRPQDRMLVTLAKVHYMNKAAEFRLLDQRYALARLGLAKVSEGHRKLHENLYQLSGEALRSQLRSLLRDMRKIYDGLAA